MEVMIVRTRKIRIKIILRKIIEDSFVLCLNELSIVPLNTSVNESNDN